MQIYGLISVNLNPCNLRTILIPKAKKWLGQPEIKRQCNREIERQ
jgi:hypothetical protein